MKQVNNSVIHLFSNFGDDEILIFLFLTKNLVNNRRIERVEVT